MRIEREDAEHIGDAWAVLSREEAWTLLECLFDYFETDDVYGAHYHIGNPDRLTVTFEDADFHTSYATKSDDSARDTADEPPVGS